MVQLVHHSGKDATKGARGWSGLRAAADVELEVLRTPTGRVMRMSKLKDGDDAGEWGFSLDIVPVGVDEFGDPVTSCVAVEAAVVHQSAAHLPKGKWSGLIVEVVSEIAIGQSRMEVAAVVDEALRRSEPPAEGRRDTRKQCIKLALRALSEGEDARYFIEDDWLEVL
jgi:hypothetical protein